jgi:hypothetical protein
LVIINQCDIFVSKESLDMAPEILRMPEKQKKDLKAVPGADKKYL